MRDHGIKFLKAASLHRAAIELMNRAEGKSPEAISVHSGPRIVELIITEDEPKRVLSLTAGEKPAPGDRALFDRLVDVVRSSPSEAEMQAAANLAMLLKRKGGGDAQPS